MTETVGNGGSFRIGPDVGGRSKAKPPVQRALKAIGSLPHRLAVFAQLMRELSAFSDQELAELGLSRPQLPGFSFLAAFGPR